MTTALAQPIQQVDSVQVQMQMFERLAVDPNASVEKIERLMALWERGETRRSESAFNVAMSSAQAEMRSIGTDAINPQTRSRYASYMAIDRELRPIYTRHGFGLSFDTADGAPEGFVRLLCYVTHGGGFARTYHADMPADGKGAKGGDVMTKTHAVGAAYTYGMRYLLKMIWNVAVGEDDRDGNDIDQRVSKSEDAPQGFDKWIEQLEEAAMGGVTALDKAWGESKNQKFRDAITVTKWRQLKDAAKEADTAGGVK